MHQGQQRVLYARNCTGGIVDPVVEAHVHREQHGCGARLVLSTYTLMQVRCVVSHITSRMPFASADNKRRQAPVESVLSSIKLHGIQTMDMRHM